MAGKDWILDPESLDYSNIVADIDAIRQVNSQRGAMEHLTAIIFDDANDQYLRRLPRCGRPGFLGRGPHAWHATHAWSDHLRGRRPDVLLPRPDAQSARLRVMGFGALNDVGFAERYSRRSPHGGLQTHQDATGTHRGQSLSSDRRHKSRLRWRNQWDPLADGRTSQTRNSQQLDEARFVSTFFAYLAIEDTYGPSPLPKLDPKSTVGPIFARWKSFLSPAIRSNSLAGMPRGKWKSAAAKGCFSRTLLPIVPSTIFLGIEVAHKYAGFTAARLAKRGLRQCVSRSRGWFAAHAGNDPSRFTLRRSMSIFPTRGGKSVTTSDGCSTRHFLSDVVPDPGPSRPTPFLDRRERLFRCDLRTDRRAHTVCRAARSGRKAT